MWITRLGSEDLERARVTAPFLPGKSHIQVTVGTVRRAIPFLNWQVVSMSFSCRQS
jgi:hypothetical protein